MERFTTKQGKTCCVTPLVSTDIDDLLAFANALISEDTTILLSGAPLTYEYEKKYVEECVEAMKQKKTLRLVARVDGKLVASADLRLGRLRKFHVSEFGISVLAEYRDSGIGKKLLEILITQAKAMGITLLVLQCFENNTRAIHVYESLGFIRSGIVPGALYYKHEYIGEITMYLPLL